MRVAALNQFKIKNDHVEHGSVTMEVVVYEQLAESQWSWIAPIQQGEYFQYQAMLILLIIVIANNRDITRAENI